MTRCPPRTIQFEGEQHREAIEHSLFGRALDDTAYAHLAGVCIPETDVVVSFKGQVGALTRPIVIRAAREGVLSVKFCLDDNQESVLHSISIKGSNNDKGLGWEIFFHHATVAQQLKRTQVTADLKCYPEGHAAGHHDGYYKGARWGFNAPLTARIRDKLTEPLKTAECLHDLMSSKQGRDFWKENGERVPHAVFDLSPGSRCWQILGQPPGAADAGLPETEIG